MKHPLAVGLLLVTAACGGQASSPRSGTEPFAPRPSVEGGGAAQPEPAPEPMVPVPTLPQPAAPEPPTPPEPWTPRLSQFDLRAQAVVKFLGEACGTCLPRVEGEDGLELPGLPDVRVLERLITQGELIPGDRRASPLWQRWSAGPRPPGASRELTSGELAVLGDLIDQLPAQAEPSCQPPPFLGHDEILAALAADLANTSSPASTRYVSLTHASNAGLCGSELQRHRSALFKQVNSVSTQPAIVVPQAVDANGLLYRIDLRDYGWDRPLDLDGDGQQDFADAWLAITAAAWGHGKELTGPEADALKAGTQTAVPLLPSHALVWATSTGGDLYYTLTGGGVNANDTRAALGIDMAEDVDGDLVRRAGYTNGRSTRDVMVLRFEQASPARAYWRLSEDDTTDSESIYDDPLDLLQDGLYISQLPNGLLAFGIENDQGARLSEVPVCSVLECPWQALGSLAACHACHESGLLPVTDMIRGFAEENVNQYDSETLRGVLVQYPGVNAIEQLIAADNQITRSASDAVGVARSGPEPLSYVQYRFEQGLLDLPAVAAELGVTPTSLRPWLDDGVPEWQALVQPGGTIDRYNFSNQYLSALCTLHAGARNRPVSCL